MTPAQVAEIARYAKEFNQRIGQFIDNAITSMSNKNLDDLFYIEDAELIAACRAYYTAYGKDGA